VGSRRCPHRHEALRRLRSRGHAPVDLRDIGDRNGHVGTFAQRLATIRARHAKTPALLARLQRPVCERPRHHLRRCKTCLGFELAWFGPSYSSRGGWRRNHGDVSARRMADAAGLEPGNSLRERLRMLLSDWLGGRDSNPDNVVQRAVPLVPSASFRAFSCRSIRHHPRPLLPVCVRSRAGCLFVSQPGRLSGHAFTPAFGAASHNC
jgi:hypothetical protein